MLAATPDAVHRLLGLGSRHAKGLWPVDVEPSPVVWGSARNAGTTALGCGSERNANAGEPVLRVESIAIGDELLDGRLADTNSRALADALAGLGLSLLRTTSVADDRNAIADAVREAAARADIVVTSGGLGPTTDDLTAEGVAQAAGGSVGLHEASWARIQARFQERGLPLPSNNRRQAEVPERAEVLENGAGVAPGFCCDVGAAAVYSFPGVPREYKWFLEHSLLPRIAHRAFAARTFQTTRTLRVLGMGESSIGAALEPFEEKYPGVRVQYRTHFPENFVRLVVQSEDEAALPGLADGLLDEARTCIGPAAYGVGDQTLAGRVVEALVQKSATVAVAESCTGGLIGAALTDVAGASRVFLGGVIAYANDVKSGLLGVAPATLATHGAVSEPVAREMAEGANARLGSQWALSVTGIAGPSGGSAEKPVGTVCFGLSSPEGTFTRTRVFPFRERDQIRQLAVYSGLRWLLKHLESEPGEDGPASSGYRP